VVFLSGLARPLGEVQSSLTEALKELPRRWSAYLGELLLDVVDWDQRFKLPSPSRILLSPGLFGEPVTNLEIGPGIVGVIAPILEVSSVASEPVFSNLFRELARDKRGVALFEVDAYSGSMGLDERPCPSEADL
jgi:hypothetical protein